jgi:nucleotide-binding universal stress UspA family protein
MTVIVGVDGSAGARAALEFAMDEAVRRQTALRVIAVVQLPEREQGSPTTCRRHRRGPT